MTKDSTVVRLHRRGQAGVCAAGMILLGLAGPAQARAPEAQHAIAMHGAPAMPDGFDHFAYVNPAAPKGGRLTEALPGTFDSLNPFIVNGLSLPFMRGYVVESLMVRGYDEPFTLYPLLAQAIETDPDRTFVTFRLDPAARFSDGTPVRPEDVIFSWELLRDKGRPNFRTYYAKVSKAQVLGDDAVRFDLTDSGDRELPLILGLMPILPRHATNADTFEQTSLAPMLGSGPYRVGDVQPGRSITLVRNPDYWGRDKAVNRGFWNFDEVRFDFYRDANAEFEAFKRGLYDFRTETDPTRWQSAYDFPAVKTGRVVREAFTTGLPKGMAAWVFNTRRPLFADRRVREALLLLFDFEWVNHNFFFDLYRRTTSYFEGSELSSHGRPADARERTLLAPYPDAVRADVLDGTWSPPVSDASGRDRASLARALALLAQAGYALRDERLVDTRTGQPFSFEILVTTRDQERLALALARDVARAGIEARVRMVDAVQYDQRQQTFDFDVIQYRWDESLSPGNEQAFYWGSAAADEPGSRNYMGVHSKAADAMIGAMLGARDRTDFVAAVRALDRVLISGDYVIPLFHLPDQWVARWSRIAHPAKTSLYGFLPETWWREPNAE